MRRSCLPRSWDRSGAASTPRKNLPCQVLAHSHPSQAFGGPAAHRESRRPTAAPGGGFPPQRRFAAVAYLADGKLVRQISSRQRISYGNSGSTSSRWNYSAQQGRHFRHPQPVLQPGGRPGSGSRSRSYRVRRAASGPRPDGASGHPLQPGYRPWRNAPALPPDKIIIPK